MTQFTDHSFAIKKMITAAYLKIFMNYSQTIAILNSLNLNWESKLMEMFNIHKAASGGFQNIVAFECFFTGININFICFYFKIRFVFHSLLQNFDYYFFSICVLFAFGYFLDNFQILFKKGLFLFWKLFNNDLNHIFLFSIYNYKFFDGFDELHKNRKHLLFNKLFVRKMHR